jgi:hypothetical protein
VILAWFSRLISLRIQELVYLITGSQDMPMVVLFLVLLPGVVLHEFSHWIVAKLLGLHPGRFRVWPKKQGKYIGLGSVSVRQGGPLADSLVGIAPLVIGSIVVTTIGLQVFATSQMTAAWNHGAWLGGLGLVLHSLNRPDGLAWAYLLFVVANAMMPSASDRQPVKSLLLYLILAGLIYFILDFPLTALMTPLEWLVAPLQALTSALLFVLVLDAFVLAILFLLYGIVLWIRQSRLA